ncbi:serine hydrolase [Cellulosimicrobium sp. Marseille-Q4280]|uniref:serine hydrolase domain-containing protein n=1 Tax=Cellulosimicrobium sp. Marseille-Q4280 TaxID=2937992 RepID=UPI00203E1D40|nr:serine hydrolase [Cellulosimicrobium sp. Marseille-Q4280]
MPARHDLLPRSTPAASTVSSRAVAALLDRLEADRVECHSIMVVRHGHVVAEGWWSPYSAGRPHLLYSLTKSFTSVAVGLAVADGLLSLDDRVVDVLPDHVPADICDQARRLTVHHLLSMTTGHDGDSLGEAWRLEPGDLTKGFLRVPFPEVEGTRHAYDNATTYVLARMVERVTGRGLPELLDERLFTPMGVDHAEWDRVASGASFGFHGLHLTTEAVAAFGELLLRGGRWGDAQLVPREWVELATSRHVETQQVEGWSDNPDTRCGYGYQFWMSRHGYRGEGSFGQTCVVVPAHDLVVVMTSAVSEGGETLLGPVWECLLPGLDRADAPADDAALAERLRHLELAPPTGTADPGRAVTARVDASAEASPLPEGSPVVVEPASGGWVVRLGGSLDVEVGHGEWRESAPLGRPVVAAGAWQGGTFVADLYVVTTPHRVRLVVDARAGTAVAVWNVVPLTGPGLERHVRSPLMTRPDVS